MKKSTRLRKVLKSMNIDKILSKEGKTCKQAQGIQEIFERNFWRHFVVEPAQLLQNPVFSRRRRAIIIKKQKAKNQGGEGDREMLFLFVCLCFFSLLFRFLSKSKHLLTSQMCYPSHRKKLQIPFLGYFRVFKKYPRKSQTWKSETIANQGTWLGIPWLGLV